MAWPNWRRLRRNPRDDLAAAQRILTAFAKAHEAGVLSLGLRVAIVDDVLHVDILCPDNEFEQRFQLEFEEVERVEKKVEILCEKRREKRERRDAWGNDRGEV